MAGLGLEWLMEEEEVEWERGMEERVVAELEEALGLGDWADPLLTFQAFAQAVEGLEAFVRKQLGQGSDLDAREARLLLSLRSLGFSVVSRRLAEHMRRLAQTSLAAFARVEGGKAAEGETCGTCLRSVCACGQLVEALVAGAAGLGRLGLLERVLGRAALAVAEAAIGARVASLAGDALGEAHLPALLHWTETELSRWLALVQPQSRPEEAAQTRELLALKVHSSLAEVLIAQLFDIVLAFPDSVPAIEDVRACCTRLPLRGKIKPALSAQIQSRLLHPGASTSDILSVYISAIRSLRLLDPSGVIADAACKQIKAFLRERSDTVRCIVEMLTEETEEGNLLESSEGAGEEEESEDEAEAWAPWELGEGSAWRTWAPEPVDADETGGRAGRLHDSIRMLVGVYGSRDVFVKEYAELLAERALRQPAMPTEKEAEYMELLKKRFHQAADLHQCEVILRDIELSRKADAFVRSQDDAPTTDLRALVMSEEFWPSRQPRLQRLRLPSAVSEAMEAYGSAFTRHKASRKLLWRTELGRVELELELGAQKLNLVTTPLRASMLSLMAEKVGKTTWSAEEVAEELGVPLGPGRGALEWGSSAGLLRAAGSGWALAEALPSSVSAAGGPTEEAEAEEEDDDGPSGAASVQELETYWSYLWSLLRNLKSLRAERAHYLLKFMNSPGRGPTLPTVKAFLDSKVSKGFLQAHAGEYKLSPNFVALPAPPK